MSEQKPEYNLKPCPFCGVMPAIQPEDPETEGDAWAIVSCENHGCPANPSVHDGERVADGRGSEKYKELAIRRWNTRAGDKP